MKAIILCAGYATRLYPLTKNMPKCLLPINNKPLINYIVDEINTIPVVDEIFVISNGLFYDKLLDWSKHTSSTKAITILNDYSTNNNNRLGAISDINLCINTYSINDDTIIIAGDNLFNFKLLDFYNDFIKYNKDSVCVKKFDNKEILKNFAVASIDKNNFITDLMEKPLKPLSDIGVFATYIYKKDTLPLFQHYINKGYNKDAPGYFLEYLYKERDVYCYEINGECFDIGTIASYEQVKDTFS